MSDSANPLAISVVIPSFNAARFLGTAVDSVRRQRPTPIEIVVVDDGSTDDTATVVAGLGPGVRYLVQANQGPAAARNAGLTQITGDLIAFLDADDWWADDALQRLSVPLLANADLDGVIGRTQLMQSVAGPDGGTVLVPMGQAGLITSLCSTLLRRRALERTGALDERLRNGEDVDWFLRAREAGVRFATIDSVTLFYRRHDRNLTHNPRTGVSGLLTSLRRSLARRREAGGDAQPLPDWLPGDSGSTGLAAR